MSESVIDLQQVAAARVIYDTLFTAAPISFDEARRRDAVPYRRVMLTAERLQEVRAQQDAA